MFEAYNKSVPLSSVCVCVCVCVCVAETARVRELKVILLLVLGRHECVREKCYINSILTLINECFLSRCRKDEVACHLLIRPASNKCIYGL